MNWVERLGLWSWNLRAKFIVTLVGLVVGVGATIGLIVVSQFWNSYRANLADRALLLARSVAVTAPTAILRNDPWFLYKSLKNMAEQSGVGSARTDVIEAMILDRGGRVLAHLQPSEHPLGIAYEPPNAAERETLHWALNARSPQTTEFNENSRSGFIEAVSPLFSDQTFLGVVRVRLSTHSLVEKASETALAVAAVTGVLVLLGSILGTLIAQRIVHPLEAMNEGLEAVARGELSNVPIVTVRDSDELGRLAKTFNRMSAELREKKALEEEIAVSEKLVALGRITAGVAHEVNNPLGGLLNCIDTLRMRPDDPALIKRYLPIIEKGLHRIRDIVKSLLIELKVEDTTQVESVRCLRAVRDLIEAEITGTKTQFIWQEGIDEEALVYGNRLQQILLNLLKNAVQAVDGAGTVSFRSYQDENCLMFEVQDDGPGIPTKHRPQLFDPFFSTKQSGTGLGLWIVYRLVQSMRGVIEVESQLQVGTRFTVTVPAIERELTGAA